MGNGAKIGRWILTVYLFSFACYTPMLLRKLGFTVPEALLCLKYGFVLVPAGVSALFLAGEQRLGDWGGAFHRVSPKEATLCAVMALIGCLTTAGCSWVGETDFFGLAYKSIPAAAASCAYLFATALVEELAWRGFLLRRMIPGNGWWKATLLVGVLWALWHIPMWTVRNALGLAEIVPLLIWTILISVELGMLYSAFGNLVSVSLLHMIMNMCFLAPVKVNCIVISAVFGAAACRDRGRGGWTRRPPC